MQGLNRIFSARLAEFAQVQALINEFGDLAAICREDRHKLTLIVEELFTNTVTHGHQGDCDAPVHIAFELDNGDVLLTYEDSAPKFNPFAAGERTDIEATIRERRVGGLGIFITIGLTAQANYDYVDGRNRIFLRIRATGN